MGADARWICHSCKTVCSRGGPPRVRLEEPITREKVANLKNMVATVSLGIDIDNIVGDIFSFLTDLNIWLSRHEHHVIHVGSDYTTDSMDLDDYHNETIDGEVAVHMRLEIAGTLIDDNILITRDDNEIYWTST